MRTLDRDDRDLWVHAELDAVERGQVLADSDAGALVAYDRGSRRWALITDRHVLTETEDEMRRLL